MSALSVRKAPEGVEISETRAVPERPSLRVADDTSAPRSSPAHDLDAALSKALAEDGLDDSASLANLAALQGRWSTRKSLAFMTLSSVALWLALILAVGALFG